MEPLPSFVGVEGINMYKRGNFVSLDFETTNLEKGSAINPNNELVLACWTVHKNFQEVGRRHIWGTEYEMRELLDDIEEAEFLVAHNAKFELQWLERCGIDLRSVLVYDTMLAEWVIHGNKQVLLGLEATAARYGVGKKESMAALSIKLGVPTQDIPEQWLLPYCYQDVDLATAIMRKQSDTLTSLNLWHIALVRNLCCAALADIELAGCELDKDKVREEYDKIVGRLAELEEELNKRAGGINLGSSKQLGGFLFDTMGFAVPKDFKGKPMLTAKGAYKTDKVTLSKLVAKTGAQEEFLKLYIEFNQLDALLTKNLEFFKQVVEHDGGKFYGVYNQGRTGTHRLSSSGRKREFPNFKRPLTAQLQNMPRQYKGMFSTHDDDYVVGEADGAQLEFRVAAEMGKDATATSEIIAGADIHSVTSGVMIDAGHPDFIGKTVKEGRQGAKAHTFAPINF